MDKSVHSISSLKHSFSKLLPTEYILFYRICLAEYTSYDYFISVP